MSGLEEAFLRWWSLLEAYGEGKSLALVEIARNATAARLLAILGALRGGAA